MTITETEADALLTKHNARFEEREHRDALRSAIVALSRGRAMISDKDIEKALVSWFRDVHISAVELRGDVQIATPLPSDDDDSISVNLTTLARALASALSLHQHDKVAEAAANWQMLEQLRAPEGASVEFVCDNPDFATGPNVYIRVRDHWTGWDDREFPGDTVRECLEAALKARALIAEVKA